MYKSINIRMQGSSGVILETACHNLCERGKECNKKASRRHLVIWTTYSAVKVCLVKAVVFPVVMYGFESWTVKKAERQRTDAFELWCWRRLESPLDCKETQPVHSEGDQPWDFFGRNDAKAETPVLWPPHVKI